MSKFARRRKPPSGFEVVEDTLELLEKELHERMDEPTRGKRKAEVLWPVHQINWQRSRYIYDMFWKYKRISKQVYDYCINNKIVDGALMNKWRKPGYELLCSMHNIDPRNFTYGTVSICRVPPDEMKPGTVFQDQYTGCRGCASGSGSNIFGNKYGQRLAKIQILREEAGTQAEEVLGSSKGPVKWVEEGTAKLLSLDNDEELTHNEIEAKRELLSRTSETVEEQRPESKHNDETAAGNGDNDSESSDTGDESGDSDGDNECKSSAAPTKRPLEQTGSNVSQQDKPQGDSARQVKVPKTET
mmetsp:Transcript_12021/g.21443  ORF Transcript_12021/g.21443 Transcript_12021/m.21443 type:complete len:301 (-) Transcript_12021:87-989(-)